MMHTLKVIVYVKGITRLDKEDDYFEGNYAMVELDNNTMVDMTEALIPIEAKEGDVLEIRIDATETEKRKKNIKESMGDLLELLFGSFFNV